LGVTRNLRSVMGVGLVVLLVTSCEPDEAVRLSPRGAASSEYWFDSLPTMVATSEAVVVGTVVDVRKGITEGPPGEQIQLMHTDLAVNESLFASANVEATLTVETLQFVEPDPDWRTVGNTVLAFLKLSTEPDTPGVYYPINEQSVYLVDGGKVQATTDDGFANDIAAMSLDEIRQEIQQATRAIAAGEVTPQRPVGG
jgi:hypothetical protein